MSHNTELQIILLCIIEERYVMAVVQLFKDICISIWGETNCDLSFLTEMCKFSACVGFSHLFGFMCNINFETYFRSSTVLS